MVLIILLNSQRENLVNPKIRCDILLIPQRPLNDMLERHVDRFHLSRNRENTCIVTGAPQWIGVPTHNRVIKFLIESLKKERVREGERRYRMDHKNFPNLKCKSFVYPNTGVSNVYEGDFVINFIRIRGGRRLAIREIERNEYELLDPDERIKIRNTINKIANEYKISLIFLAHHMHPAEKR